MTNCTVRALDQPHHAAAHRRTATLTDEREAQVFSVRKGTVNVMVGIAASSMPRRPPSAAESCLRTTCSTVCRRCRGMRLVSRRLRRWGSQCFPGVLEPLSTSARSAGCTSPGRGPARRCGPRRGSPSRRDAGDPSAAKPDDADRAGAVVQLGLERRHPPRGRRVTVFKVPCTTTLWRSGACSMVTRPAFRVSLRSSFAPHVLVRPAADRGAQAALVLRHGRERSQVRPIALRERFR